MNNISESDLIDIIEYGTVNIDFEDNLKEKTYKSINIIVYIGCI